MVGDQRCDFSPQSFVTGAGGVEKRGALALRQVDDLMK
jgi:hypothetical protein